MTAPGTPARRTLSLIGAAVLIAGDPASAQDVSPALEDARDAVREAFDPGKAGALYAASVAFTVQPDLSTASFNLDGLEDSVAREAELNNHKLVLRHVFGDEDDARRLFVQGSLGYQDLSVTLPLVQDGPDQVVADWRSTGADLGAGLELGLGEHWTLLPSVNLGAAELRNRADYGDSVLGPILQPVFEGIIFDWETNAWIAGAGIAGRYDRSFERIEIHANGGLTTSYIRSFSESREDIVIDDTATTVDLELSTIHPMGTVYDRPWSLVTIVGATGFLGEARDELGFNEFFEAGLAIQFDIGGSPLPIQSLRIGLKAIAGADVSGWALVIGPGI